MKKLLSRKNFLLPCAFLVLCLLIAVGCHAGKHTERVTNTQERTAFLRSLGWQTAPDTEESAEIHIPEVFPPVYEAYNELQRSQGYDLRDYAGRDCTLYSYTVTNYADTTQTVIADLYVVNNRVIGGDIHSTAINGFMVGIR